MASDADGQLRDELAAISAAQDRQARLIRDLRISIDRASDTMRRAAASGGLGSGPVSALSAADRQLLTQAVARLERLAERGGEATARQAATPSDRSAEIRALREDLTQVTQRLQALQTAVGEQRAASAREVAALHSRIGDLAVTAREMRGRVDTEAEARQKEAGESREAVSKLLAAVERIEGGLAAGTGTRATGSVAPGPAGGPAQSPSGAGAGGAQASLGYAQCRRTCLSERSGAEAAMCSALCLCETQCLAQSDRESCVAYCRSTPRGE